MENLILNKQTIITIEKDLVGEKNLKFTWIIFMT